MSLLHMRHFLTSSRTQGKTRVSLCLFLAFKTLSIPLLDLLLYV